MNNRVSQLGAFLLVCLAVALTASVPTVEAQDDRILLFTETAGYRHRSISDAVTAIEDRAAEAGVETVVASSSTGFFTDDELGKYRAVVWISTTGNVLDDDEKAAFERYVQAGGGYVGIHGASDANPSAWPWYEDLVGTLFDGHPSIQNATIHVADVSHPSTNHLGATWERNDEWYNFGENPRGIVEVLLTLDESTYSGGTMGDDHPIAWYHDFEGGRSFYTGGGHTSASFSEDAFVEHIWGGIVYAGDIGGATTINHDVDLSGSVDNADVQVLLDTLAAMESHVDGDQDGDGVFNLSDPLWLAKLVDAAGQAS